MVRRTSGTRALNRGVTLIELMVTVAVAGILAAIAFPSFQDTLRSNRVSAATNQLVGAISLARSEAVRNTRGSGVCASSDGANCAAGSNWSAGMLVWSDVNGNGTFDAGTDTALRYLQGSPSLVMTGPANANSVRFDSRGRLATGAQQNITLRPSDCGGKPYLRTLIVGVTGQVRKNGGLSTCQ